MTENRENFENLNQKLLTFVDNSPTSFHAVDNMKAILEEAGYNRLLEGESWKLKEAGIMLLETTPLSLLFRFPKEILWGFRLWPVTAILRL